MDHYGKENPRFRRAFIRERLEALKLERMSLVAEREQLDREIASRRAPTARTADRDPDDTAAGMSA